MKILFVFFLSFSAYYSFAQNEAVVSPEPDSIIDGVIVDAEYHFDMEFVLTKNNQTVYMVQADKKNNRVGIMGINNPIGKYTYNQVLVDPNTDSFIYLDSKSMTGVPTSIPIVKSKEKTTIKLLATEEVKILDKSCIVVSVENNNFLYKIWLTKEENSTLVNASINALNILLNTEHLGELGEFALNNQTWMKITVVNKKTKKENSYELTQYYKETDESVMTFDYQFITPKWD